MKHKKLKIFCICMGVVLGIYLIILINTNTLIAYVKSIYNGEISFEEVEDTPYESFNIDYARKDGKEYKVDLSIRRVFVIHNFKDGYMYVNIDCKMFDSNNKPAFVSIGPERWKIHKHNGKWEIIEKKEMVSFIPLPKGFTNS